MNREERQGLSVNGEERQGLSVNREDREERQGKASRPTLCSNEGKARYTYK